MKKTDARKQKAKQAKKRARPLQSQTQTVHVNLARPRTQPPKTPGGGPNRYGFRTPFPQVVYVSQPQQPPPNKYETMYQRTPTLPLSKENHPSLLDTAVKVPVVPEQQKEKTKRAYTKRYNMDGRRITISGELDKRTSKKHMTPIREYLTPMTYARGKTDVDDEYEEEDYEYEDLKKDINEEETVPPSETEVL